MRRLRDSSDRAGAGAGRRAPPAIELMGPSAVDKRSRVVSRTSLGGAVLLVLAGVATLWAPPAAAASLTVTSTADVATNFGACGNPAQTTSSGSLREAICAANNAGATSSTITV